STGATWCWPGTGWWCTGSRSATTGWSVWWATTPVRRCTSYAARTGRSATSSARPSSTPGRRTTPTPRSPAGSLTAPDRPGGHRLAPNRNLDRSKVADWSQTAEAPRLRLHRLGDARHVEVRHPERGHGGPGEVVVAPLTAEGRPGGGGVGEPGQQVERALVEAEGVHRAGDLAVLHEVDAVAGEAGQQQGLR